MGTSSETHEVARGGSAAVDGAARLAAASPSWSSQERSPFPALPDGWSVIGRCRFGTGMPGPYATGCYALAHPKVGVALIDIVPDATPNAEARLRRALTAVEFWPDFPGTLPVVHNRLDSASLRSLPWVLERWFAALPALTVPGGSAWIEGVRRAMAADPAWELPGHPKPLPDAPPAARDDNEVAAAPRPKRGTRDSARPRRWGRLATLPLAFATVFGLGLVSGFLLLESPVPTEQPTSAAAQVQPPAAAPPEAAAPKPVEVAAAAPQTQAQAPTAPSDAPKPVTGAAAPQAEPAAAAAAPVPAYGSVLAAARPTPLVLSPPPPQPEPAAPEAPPAAAPDEPDAMRKVAGLALDAGAAATAQAGSSLETPVSLAVPIGEALPMAPPLAPTPPPVRVSSSQPAPRPAPVIDRACSRALFRFQQGERLTAAEQSFVRNGCSTARR